MISRREVSNTRECLEKNCGIFQWDLYSTFDNVQFGKFVSPKDFIFIILFYTVFYRFLYA